jgi:Protein of unknown function (DUF3363)
VITLYGLRLSAHLFLPPRELRHVVPAPEKLAKLNAPT